MKTTYKYAFAAALTAAFCLTGNVLQNGNANAGEDNGNLNLTTTRNPNRVNINTTQGERDRKSVV